jgi:urease accessory protein UreE
MVQESRFRLATPNGQTLLLALSHAARIDEADLLEFYRQNTPVVVEFEGEPGLSTGIARSLAPLGESAR